MTERPLNMTSDSRQILLVDDEEKFLKLISQRLKMMGFGTLTATNGADAVDIIRQNPIDIAIVDLDMPGINGLVTIAKLKEITPGLQTVLLTGHGNDKVKQATESLNSGYFEKHEMRDFWGFIEKLHSHGNVVVIRPNTGGTGTSPEIVASHEIEIRPGPDARDAAHSPDGLEQPCIVGETPAMQTLRKKIERVATLDCPVILKGETGTGKELAARRIHALSSRSNGRFLAINCGYFGNDPVGGQPQFDKNGGNLRDFFNAARQGTILLDQIEDMSQQMQIQLLKIIDNAGLPRADKTKVSSADIRILASTGADLAKRAESGSFRKDLYYRLNLLELTIPPLRDRKDDIAPLSHYFLDKHSKLFGKSVESISGEVLDTFTAYSFPGNVRELEHVIERAIILADDRTIDKKHLPARFRKNRTTAQKHEKPHFLTLAEIEINYILEVLEGTGGKKSQAAEVLGISRAALWRKLKQLKESNAR
jgi:DNA-binding NtrC family response regulator